MQLTLELRASVRCPGCAVMTPLLGPQTAVSCRGCAARIDVAALAADARQGGLRYPFGAYYDAVAEAALLLRDDQPCRDARSSHGSPVALRRLAGPACDACEAPLPWPAAGASELACGCGERMAVRWPDAASRAWDPRLTCVVGGQRAASAEAREPTAEGKVIGCGQCGAPLAGTTQDRRRARTCAHCGALNVLGDAAWLALFPQPEWHRAFLLYELDDERLVALHDALLAHDDAYFLDDGPRRALEAGRKAAEAAPRRRRLEAAARGELRGARLEGLLEDEDLTDEEVARLDPLLDDAARVRIAPKAAPATLRRWAQAASPPIRALVAAHPKAPAALLTRLSRDPEARVRAAAAARPELSAEALAQLRKDPAPEVVAAVRANPSYVPGFWEKLFG